MELPPFPEKRPQGQIKSKKIDKSKREGKIEFNHKINKFLVVKGDKQFGSYDTMTEAYLVKKTLMENEWDPQSLKVIQNIKDNMMAKEKSKKDQYKLPTYCPKCSNKVKEDTVNCPFCGINIKEYKL